MTEASNIRAGGDVQQIAAGGNVQVTSHTETGDTTARARYGCLATIIVGIITGMATLIAAWIR